MSVIDDLQARGHKLQHEGSGNYRLRGHGGLVLKNNGCWYSHSQAKGGGYASLMTHLGEVIESGFSLDNLTISEQTHQRKELNKGLYTLSSRGYLYLMDRGIDLDLLRLLANQGLIQQDVHGYVAFVGYDENSQVRCVSKRAIVPWFNVQRYESAGSEKCYSFSFPLKSSGKNIILCEGPIDALSIACLEHRKHHKGYEQTVKISTCGAPTPHILSRIRRYHPEKLYLAFDRDDAGRTMAQQVRHGLRYSTINTMDVSPGVGKDPNDWLMAL